MPTITPHFWLYKWVITPISEVISLLIAGRGGGMFKGGPFVAWRTSCSNLKAGSMSPPAEVNLGRGLAATCTCRVSRGNPMENAMKNVENMGLLALKKEILAFSECFSCTCTFFLLGDLGHFEGGRFFSNLSPKKKMIRNSGSEGSFFFNPSGEVGVISVQLLAGEGDDGSKGWPTIPPSSRWQMSSSLGWDFPGICIYVYLCIHIHHLERR